MERCKKNGNGRIAIYLRANQWINDREIREEKQRLKKQKLKIANNSKPKRNLKRLLLTTKAKLG